MWTRGTPDADDIASAARVTIAETSVTVDLSNDWRSGGELVVVLRNVQTPIPRSLSSTTAGIPADDTAGLPYHNYAFTVSSKKSGRLDRLDPILINHDADDANNNGLTDDTEANNPESRVKATDMTYSRAAMLSGLEIFLERRAARGW